MKQSAKPSLLDQFMQPARVNLTSLDDIEDGAFIGGGESTSLPASNSNESTLPHTSTANSNEVNLPNTSANPNKNTSLSVPNPNTLPVVNTDNNTLRVETVDEVYGGLYQQRDQDVESFESYEDGIEVISLKKALEKYPWFGK